MHLTFSGNSSECVSIDTSNRSEECDLAQSTEGGNTNTFDICHPIFISDDLVVLCVCLCACVLGVCQYMTGLLLSVAALRRVPRAQASPEPVYILQQVAVLPVYRHAPAPESHPSVLRPAPTPEALYPMCRPAPEGPDGPQLPASTRTRQASLCLRQVLPSLTASPHPSVSGRLGGDGLRFPGVVIRPLCVSLFQLFPCLFVNHVSVGMIVMNYACSL